MRILKICAKNKNSVKIIKQVGWAQQRIMLSAKKKHNDRFIHTRSQEHNQWWAEHSQTSTQNYEHYIKANMMCSSKGFGMKECYSQSTAADLFSTVGSKSMMTGVPHPKADKVLDANRYRDDFYLNNLDWGKHGVAVALDDEVYMEFKDGFEMIGEGDNSDYVTSVKLIDDILSVGWSNGQVHLHDVTRNICFRKIKEHDNRISVQSKHQNPNLLLTGSKDNHILSHDLRLKKSVIASYLYHRGEVCSLQFQPSSNYFASGSNDNRVVIWDTRKSEPMLKLKGHRGAIKALSWCPWKNSVLCSGGGTGDRSLRLWNAQENRLLSVKKTESQLSGVVWNKSSEVLISSHGHRENTIQMWKMQEDYEIKCVCELQGHKRRILSIAQSPQEDFICTAGSDQTLRFWVVDSNAPANEKRSSSWGFKLK